MRERAHLAGGWLTAGPDGEQFRVTLFLPYGTADNRPAAGAVLEDPDSGEPGSGHTTGLALDSGAREEKQDA
ncbi:hypothetical protein [Arthrobacter koreensis]|uniref:hypothetical protein n=1 Tax=Arthrobacter koreensis TaxID=199136 RepID=UPI002DBE5B79|nr:hypothetical protein [Arthrobacter koreensis]MEB7505839.1 hypothetical protein [Arthrobacter koreensis]